MATPMTRELIPLSLALTFVTKNVECACTRLHIMLLVICDLLMYEKGAFRF